MEAYRHTDREYFRGLDEQAAEENFVETRQEEIWNGIKNLDKPQLDRLEDNIDPALCGTTLRIIATLLAQQSESKDTKLESLLRTMFDASIMTIIKDEITDMKDQAFEDYMERA